MAIYRDVYSYAIHDRLMVDSEAFFASGWLRWGVDPLSMDGFMLAYAVQAGQSSSCMLGFRSRIYEV